MFPRHTLTSYVVAVIIIMAILIGVFWLIGGYDKAQKLLTFFIGFICGMIAMYIAVHVYADNIWPWLSSHLRL
jgi:putative flippase GtrA